MMHALYRKSHWIHKWLGLPLILFLIWMSLSGIFLNHPELIEGISVPGWLVPPQYHLVNWNRSSLINLTFSQADPDIAFAAGKQGVWMSADGGRTFRPLDDGFPASRFYRKTNDILLSERAEPHLFAATNGGLYVCDPGAGRWRQLPLGRGRGREPVRKVLEVGDEYLAFTDSHIYRSAADAALNFSRVDLPRAGGGDSVTLVKLFFDLHGGSIWGLPGKLLFDLVGLMLFFLCLSAFYIWFYPWKRRRRARRDRSPAGERRGRAFGVLLKYHLKIGIFVATVLLVMGVTGFFMRPPMLALIAEGSIDSRFYPGPLEPNPWLEKIRNALYDHVDDRIVIDATDGFWTGPADLSAPFERIELGVPVFVMGATVFETYGDGGYLVGSFNGIYHVERESGRATDMLTGREAGSVSSVRPAETMVTGYFRTPDGDEFITSHEQGLLPLSGAERQGRFEMPAAMARDYAMPLWNYLFELHNGRMFKDLVGDWYILILPLGSLLFLLVILSGVYDWLYLKLQAKAAADREVTD